jgi:hypothetical protein
MKNKAKLLLEKHGCKLIKMESECTVVWQNCIGITRVDDIAVLRHMTDKAWKYWAYN